MANAFVTATQMSVSAPCKPWQRWSNGRTDGLLRQHVPMRLGMSRHA
ncbi:IS30 family transposase [Streptomyces canus]|uniref:IS30 family transposase n=1 Tax=Streptomyces canus TaxID=58343 RepID=A0AAW8F405_9ACTN|nr:IS30 family transposase [Streptomyces canus]